MLRKGAHTFAGAQDTCLRKVICIWYRHIRASVQWSLWDIDFRLMKGTKGWSSTGTMSAQLPVVNHSQDNLKTLTLLTLRDCFSPEMWCKRSFEWSGRVKGYYCTATPPVQVPVPVSDLNASFAFIAHFQFDVNPNEHGKCLHFSMS